MNKNANERRARVATFMLSMGMLAGVLIWAKLRLVTDIPRSALAVPEEIDSGVDDQGSEIVDTIDDDRGGDEVDDHFDIDGDVDGDGVDPDGVDVLDQGADFHIDG
ncbi:MAG: hypothetical protein JJ974_05810 [Phycisphaerales bacterium]|nr:hypothetical protein [Phycisphaerales bacterium]